MKIEFWYIAYQGMGAFFFISPKTKDIIHVPPVKFYDISKHYNCSDINSSLYKEINGYKFDKGDINCDIQMINDLYQFKMELISNSIMAESIVLNYAKDFFED